MGHSVAADRQERAAADARSVRVAGNGSVGDVELPAGASAERGDDGGPLLLGLRTLALRVGLALLGVSDPAPPLLDAHLRFLEVSERVSGLGSGRLELDAVVLVSRVLRADPLLQDLDLALRSRQVVAETCVVIEKLADAARTGRGGISVVGVTHARRW